METVLIVEVDRVYARATTNWLVKNGINARYVLSVDAAKDFLNNYDAVSYTHLTLPTTPYV